MDAIEFREQAIFWQSLRVKYQKEYMIIKHDPSGNICLCIKDATKMSLLFLQKHRSHHFFYDQECLKNILNKKDFLETQKMVSSLHMIENQEVLIKEKIAILKTPEKMDDCTMTDCDKNFIYIPDEIVVTPKTTRRWKDLAKEIIDIEPYKKLHLTSTSRLSAHHAIETVSLLEKKTLKIFINDVKNKLPDTDLIAYKTMDTLVFLLKYKEKESMLCAINNG